MDKGGVVVNILLFLAIVTSVLSKDTDITKEDKILRKKLIEEFGVKQEIYTDCKNRKRLGVGHIIKGFEKEYYYAVGTPVERKVCEERFDQDIRLRLAVCMKSAMFTSFRQLPQNVQYAIIMVMFEMSIQEFFINFADFRSAINDHDWTKAANILVNSPTLMCNPGRVRRLAERDSGTFPERVYGGTAVQLIKRESGAIVISGEDLDSEDNNSNSGDSSGDNSGQEDGNSGMDPPSTIILIGSGS